MNSRERLGMNDGNGDSTQQTQRHQTLLVVREAIILESKRRSFEYSGCIDEVQPMIFQVETTLLFIPGKPHDVVYIHYVYASMFPASP